MAPTRRNEDGDPDVRVSIIVDTITGLRDEVRDLGSRLRKIEDAVLIINAKASVHWSVFAAGWGLVGAIAVGVVVQYIKK